MENVVLVTKNDVSIGCMEKEEAHRQGALHRAFSVCLFDDQGRWLLQRRSAVKYHSPLRLSNSCCGHPRQGESPEEGARRRLSEELGIFCPLEQKTSFYYRADVGGGMIEHEFDHLFTGIYSGLVHPNPDEVAEIVWWTTDQIVDALKNTPEIFTSWFPIVVKQMVPLLAGPT